MQTSPVLVLLSCAFLAGASGSSLPSYIRPCARTDPKFNDCVVARGNKAIPELVKGDGKNGVPLMDPLFLKEVQLTQAQNKLKLELRDINIFGLKDAKVTGANFDLKKRHLSIDYRIPIIHILGQYEMSGKSFSMAANGKGDINITLVDCEAHYSMNYHIDDGNHMVCTDPKTTMQVHRVYFQLDNLFNGDKLLGKQLNGFINENWRDVYKELSPGMTDAFSQFTNSMLNKLASHVSYDDLFPETLP